MQEIDDSDNPRKKRRLCPPETGPYLLRSFVDEVEVAAEDGQQDVHISCVEYWKLRIDCDLYLDENLYIGTSEGEILHFVSLPPGPDDDSNKPSLILASRLPINRSQNASTQGTSPGVQEILILPAANKACVLCNGTVTFYTLPELSPAYNSTKVGHCRWIGGCDQNEDEADEPEPVIMIAVRNRIMLVRIGEEPRVKNLEFPGCLASSRRGTIACVADDHTYSLLDVEHQQKIPLFPISSSDEVFEPSNENRLSGSGTPLTRSSSASYGNAASGDDRGHSRSTSLNALVGAGRGNSPQPSVFERSNSGTPESFQGTRSPARSESPGKQPANSSKPLPETPTPESGPAAPKPQKPLPTPPKSTISRLKPLITSPTPSEFLLVTGTDISEPGVGMFVNTDGDVVRGTLEFERYPDTLVLDRGNEQSQLQPSDSSQEGYVLAVMGAAEDGAEQKRLEIQRWDLDPGEGDRPKSWVHIPLNDQPLSSVGMRHSSSPKQVPFPEVEDILRLVRLKSSFALSSHPPTPPDNPDPRTKASLEHFQKEKELFDAQEMTDSDGSKKPTSETLRQGWEAERNKEEAKFARGLGKSKTSLILWSGNQIWHVIKNPLALQLHNELEFALESQDDKKKIDRAMVMNIVHRTRNIEPSTESEAFGLKYIRQKISLLLLADLLSIEQGPQLEQGARIVEGVLLSGDLDPRIVLLLLPLLRGEVLPGPQGIWVHGGLADVAEYYINPSDESGSETRTPRHMDDTVLDMIKRYLFTWQKKRGYGSVTDETYVFDSVDAALLQLLLFLDYKGISGSPFHPSVRSELNKVVDTWKGNFSRAVGLLEKHHRLFVLSRLYQSRKMSRHVLGTWKRIAEGEQDYGSEMSIPDIEIQVRRYLVKIRDVQLVEEYGSWLAARNPKLGVQVFSEDNSRAKMEPAEVVKLFKKRAPKAVQEYLEHLVFAKNYSQYSDDLIAYYLDTVLSVLESSPEARTSLTESYSTYRALRPPKPTYLNFITQNAPRESWWQSRLRLLQLLGGGGSSQYTAKPTPNKVSYSIPTVLARIEPFQNELVSESIILDGRQGRHREALHLLTHGLGDYDTAIRYCLFGGPTTSSSTSITTTTPAKPALQTELFTHLLKEFLQISNPSDRIERTSDLLARFAPWFDVSEVLSLVPDDWSVGIMSEFLVHVLRGLATSTREARIQRALSAGYNLRAGAEYLDDMEKIGAWVEDAEGVRSIKDGSRLGVDNGEGEEDGDDGGGDGDWGEMVSANIVGGDVSRTGR